MPFLVVCAAPAQMSSSEMKRVVRVMGQNPGPFTLEGTNTYLVGTGRSRVLIDAGEGRPEFDAALQEAMAANGVDTIQAILCTHYHYDHTRGVPSVQRLFNEAVPVYKVPNARVDAGLGFTASHLEPGRLFTIDADTTLETVFTPGHTPDHVSFYLREEHALFTGDCILGRGSTIFADLGDYMASLALLQDTFGHGRLRLYPGHGPIVEDGTAKIEEYIQHRKEREQQVLAALETRKATVTQLVETLYPPDLDEKRKRGASSNVEQVLRVLLGQERVRQQGSVWELV